VPAPSTDFGNGDDFGDGWGNGDGEGGGFGKIPTTMGKRCSKKDRLQRLQENGGTEKCEEAVVKGLDWLQKTQNKDGSWDTKWKSAMTGFALLSYLGHCETPLSDKYGETVLSGLIYLIDLGMKNDGKLIPDGGEKDSNWPYEQAIACYALGEATTFCKQLGMNIPNLEKVTQKAGQYIIDNQHNSGAWTYSYSKDLATGGDLSFTAWHLQALKACRYTGLDFSNITPCIAKSLKFVSSCQASSGGYGYYYTDQKPADRLNYHTLTGAGMLCLQMLGKGRQPGVRKGAEYIIAHSKFDWNTEFCDLYGHYYESQAMMNQGGKAWKKYNAMFRDQVLNNQAPDGSWTVCGGGKTPRAIGPLFTTNVHYRSCLSILMLETYYRFLPATGSKFR
jgi:hypothetical protein